ncbi:hypothetical protein T492DRAFT_1045488 [Pavlovales sp. CCMP2436]|nr:hypothetical protein T492DRAFT_1045488 [Pavlovales sp. CCMP2436]
MARAAAGVEERPAFARLHHLLPRAVLLLGHHPRRRLLLLALVRGLGGGLPLVAPFAHVDERGAGHELVARRKPAWLGCSRLPFLGRRVPALLIVVDERLGRVRALGAAARRPFARVLGDRGRRSATIVRLLSLRVVGALIIIGSVARCATRPI